MYNNTFLQKEQFLNGRILVGLLISQANCLAVGVTGGGGGACSDGNHQCWALVFCSDRAARPSARGEGSVRAGAPANWV